ncbi:MAG: pyridoxamine 5'-phosphate oxidase family protein [Bacillota bacterium]
MSLLLGTELNAALKNFFEKRLNTVIIATIDKDCRPHTAPFNYLTVYDSKHLRVVISKFHQTYLNIVENVYVAVAVLDEGDLAVCIKGLAHVIKESMAVDCNLVIVEIEILEIRKDNSTDFFVTQGVRIRHKNEPSLYYSRKIFQELTQFETGNK